MRLPSKHYDEIIEITPTVASNKVSIEANTSITKQGSVVCACIMIRLTGTFAYKEALLNNFPIPRGKAYMVNDYVLSGDSLTFAINENGKLETRGSSTLSNALIVLNITYLTND